MASCSSRSVRDRELQSGSRTVDVDTYQALTVCTLARDVCKSPFQIMGRQNRTPATIRGENTVILLLWISSSSSRTPAHWYLAPERALVPTDGQSHFALSGRGTR